MPFKTVLKTVGKKAENMNTKLNNFPAMQNIRMQNELNEELHKPKKTEAATPYARSHLASLLSVLTNAGSLLNSRSA